MLYAITLDRGTTNERLFIAPADKLEPILDDLRQYCKELVQDGPYEFFEIPVQSPIYDPQDLSIYRQ